MVTMREGLVRGLWVGEGAVTARVVPSPTGRGFGVEFKVMGEGTVPVFAFRTLEQAIGAVEKTLALVEGGLPQVQL